jgi:branched-chain amino acid transport system ATP-binding protein
MLELKEVDAFYGDAQALKRVSITVEEGTIVALAGANGAGKTTIIRTISGLMRPRSGTVRFRDWHLTSLSPENIVKLGISMVPEGRRLFSRMTVWRIWSSVRTREKPAPGRPNPLIGS